MSDKMSDVKSKSKKVDVRFAEEVFKEIAKVAWLLEITRSKLVRRGIDDFIQKATFEVDGQLMNWSECVAYATAKMLEENISLDDLQRSRANHPAVEFTEEMKEDIDEATDILLKVVKNNIKQGLRG